ncbi:DUF6503 family protein [Maribacter halichondriae]|uniref:DUF6503 family protein n=1 Tax=Maribacter halichondriae TaxID=2980554 RepID=UPI0023583910|nr:DUF6503 family protein [Maribacter sp. Hal144]
MRKKFVAIILCIAIYSCKEKEPTLPSAQEIVDKSIEVCGGDLYEKSNVFFEFRDKSYASDVVDGRRILKRITTTDSSIVLDVKSPGGFERFVNDSLVTLHDTLANKYSNSVNSVHYFAYLPFGLNDPAVNKSMLGKVKIKNEDYFKIKVTFDQQDGGDDFDDVYVYWFNTETLKPDYLAYEFHVDGGGMRLREAYNERRVGGIRFVDYRNYQPEAELESVLEIDKAFESGELELLSKIELKNITLE